MFQKFQAIFFIAALGFLGCCHANTLKLKPKENATISMQINLKDVLTKSSGNSILGSAAKYTITSGGPGRIHFMKINFYTDSPFNPCNTPIPTVSPVATASILDNGPGFSFATSDTISLNATSTYSLVANQIGAASADTITCMQLYVDGSNATNNGINCTAFTETCGAGTCSTSTSTPSVTWGSGPTQCSTPATTPTNASAPFVYISNYLPNEGGDYFVTQCAFGSTPGDLNESSCTQLTSTQFDSPFDIGANNAYAIVANIGASCLNCGSVGICRINPATGTFLDNSSADTCMTYGALPSTLGNISVTSPSACYANDQFVYFTDSGYSGGSLVGNPYVYVCTFSSASTGGTLSNCARTASSYAFNGPIELTINYNISNNTTYAYITDTSTTSGKNVVICTVNSDGTFTSCNGYNLGLDLSTVGGGIAINNGYVYITNAGPSQSTSYVYACPINLSNGTINPCTSYVGTTYLFNTPTDIAIHDGYAYVTNQSDSSITYCAVSGITLSGCTNTALGGTLNNPGGLSIY